MDRLPDDVWSSPGFAGKYRFEQPISTGSMAIVAKARHLELDECVAIKFLAPAALSSPAAVARFRREAQAAAKIKSQHVVRILDVSTTVSEIPYIVMEYLEGSDLERLLGQRAEHQIPIEDAVDYVLQASEALIEGHALGIVHRDLKPANLFCVDRGDGYPLIKVLDFGISKFAATGSELERTDRHEILGSPRYMSPEQIDATCNVDHRTDIWALGVILYEAIGGQAPFAGDFVPELWRKIRQATPAALTTLRPECPTELAQVVTTCLQRIPTSRYPDLGVLAKALAPFAPERSRPSIARIRFNADATAVASGRPTTVSEPYVRSATTHTGQHQRWFFATGLALAVGATLSYLAVRVGNEPIMKRFEPPLPHSSIEPVTSPASAESAAAAMTLPLPTAMEPMEPPPPKRGRPPSRGERNKTKRLTPPAALLSATARPTEIRERAPASVGPQQRADWILAPIEKRKQGAHD